MTAADLNLDAFDLADNTDRLVLADLLGDAGRTEEEALVRGREALRACPDSGRVVLWTDPAVAALVERIEAELERLDAACTHSTPEGIAVYADDELPRGWVRVSDSGATVYGPGAEMLAELEEVEYNPEEDNGWELAWESLVFSERPPLGSRDWPAELFQVRRLDGCVNDNGNCLVRVETNSGPRWAAGPHGVSYCALRGALEMNGLRMTEEEALASVEDGDDA